MKNLKTSSITVFAGLIFCIVSVITGPRLLATSQKSKRFIKLVAGQQRSLERSHFRPITYTGVRTTLDSTINSIRGKNCAKDFI